MSPGAEPGAGRAPDPRVVPLAGAREGIPNNPRYPALVYRSALGAGPGPLPGPEAAALFEALFARHGWTGAWRNGIFPFEHFHPDAHEVLGVFQGRPRVALGGPGGVVLELAPGDVVVVPAGVSHRRLGEERIGVVGAYPPGQSPAVERPLRTPSPREMTALRERVAGVPVPASDPVLGPGRGLATLWRQASAGGEDATA